MRAPPRRLALVQAVIYLAVPDLTVAQQSKIPRVGIVWIGARPQVAYIHDHFVQGLRERGWVDRQHVVIVPVDQAETLEFHVNRKTAKPLGLTIPQPLLFRADRVIDP